MRRRLQGSLGLRGCSSEVPPSSFATRLVPSTRMKSCEESSPWCTGSVSEQASLLAITANAGNSLGKKIWGKSDARLAGLKPSGGAEEGWALILLSVCPPCQQGRGIAACPIPNGICLENRKAPWLRLLLPECGGEGCKGRHGKSEQHSKQGMGGFLETQGVCTKPQRQQTERSCSSWGWEDCVGYCNAQNRPKLLYWEQTLGKCSLSPRARKGRCGGMCACLQALL